MYPISLQNKKILYCKTVEGVILTIMVPFKQHFVTKWLNSTPGFFSCFLSYTENKYVEYKSG